MSTPNRKTRFFALVAALLLTVMGTPPAAAQTFEEAVTAYERGNHAAAFQGFRVHAERGDARAQLYFGDMYAKGEGVPQDHAEALRWHRRAAEQGHTSAQTHLGAMYAKGKGVPRDPVMAVRWFRRKRTKEAVVLIGSTV